jgi:hypothetical protein
MRKRKRPKWYNLCLQLIEKINYIVPKDRPHPTYTFYTYVRKGRLRWTYYWFRKYVQSDITDVHILYKPILDNLDALTSLIIAYHKKEGIKKSDTVVLQCLYQTIEYKLTPFIYDKTNYNERMIILYLFCSLY